MSGNNVFKKKKLGNNVSTA